MTRTNDVLCCFRMNVKRVILSTCRLLRRGQGGQWTEAFQMYFWFLQRVGWVMQDDRVHSRALTLTLASNWFSFRCIKANLGKVRDSRARRRLINLWGGWWGLLTPRHTLTHTHRRRINLFTSRPSDLERDKKIKIWGLHYLFFPPSLFLQLSAGIWEVTFLKPPPPLLCESTWKGWGTIQMSGCYKYCF